LIAGKQASSALVPMLNRSVWLDQVLSATGTTIPIPTASQWSRTLLGRPLRPQRPQSLTLPERVTEIAKELLGKGNKS
jgi:hypothetical protein